MLSENAVKKDNLAEIFAGEDNFANKSIDDSRSSSTVKVATPSRLKKFHILHYLSQEFITQDAPGLKSAVLREKYIKYLIFDLMNDFVQFRFTDIKFTNKNGKKGKHAPFAKVIYRKDVAPAMYWKPKIVDVWSREEIFANWDWFPNYYRASRRYARKKGWDYLLVTDIFFDSPYFKNIEFLVPHLDLLPKDADFNKRCFRLIKALEELDGIRIKYLLEFVSDTDEDRQKYEMVLWHLFF
ncbi:MAG TPA: hypothetical protein PKY82_33540 [Pyrinomonadaceae bacterium]|nr:hypothetical protein [Pyrinomonadaceae bacterium]